MLRSIAKDAVAGVVSWAGLDAVRQEPYIVGYHRVVERLNAHENFALPAMEISVSMLEKHLDWLGRNFEITSLDHLTMTMNRRSRSKPLAAVTFDDGYSDVFHNAFPLLKRKGIPAAIFVVTDLIGTREAPVHDRLYAALFRARIPNPFRAAQDLLRNRDYEAVLRVIHSLDGNPLPTALHPVTWEMLAEMRDAGLTIGSHSKTHAFLRNESRERVEEEVRDSRTALQKHLGIEAGFFAYPGGDFSPTVVEAVRAAGYRCAFTICRHRDRHYPMLTISRRGLWQRSCVDRFGHFSAPIMSCHAAAVFGRPADCPNHH